jgi:hypothetical protein
VNIVTGKKPGLWERVEKNPPTDWGLHAPDSVPTRRLLPFGEKKEAVFPK